MLAEILHLQLTPIQLDHRKKILLLTALIFMALC